jgi:catechol 2,3-dioxygenase-like lactoylglutathione lyase family enzyme
MALVGVADLTQARAFYEQTLGLPVISEDAYALVANVGGVRVRLTKVPAVQPAFYTVLGFEVRDTQATVHHLSQAGIKFEHYAFLGAAQAADGIWQAPSGTHVAWFKDPDGNLLSVSDGPN